MNNDLHGNLNRIEFRQSCNNDIGRIDYSETSENLQTTRNIPEITNIDQGSPARKRIRLSQVETQSLVPNILQKLLNKVNTILDSKISLNFDGLSVKVA